MVLLINTWPNTSSDPCGVRSRLVMLIGSFLVVVCYMRAHMCRCSWYFRKATLRRTNRPTCDTREVVQLNDMRDELLLLAGDRIVCQYLTYLNLQKQGIVANKR